MKKKWGYIILLLSIVFTMTACKTAVNHTETIKGEKEGALHSDSSDAIEDGEEYIVEEAVIVDDGKRLTLKLHGKKLSDDEYGINTIEVLDEENPIQSISIHDAILAEWDGTDDFDGYTQSFMKDSGFTNRDMNFDGSGDIGLMGWTTTGANVPYYYWIWNKEKKQFEYAFSLSNVEVDSKNKQLISRTRSSAVQYEVNYYEYDADGKLLNVKRIVRGKDKDGKMITDIYEIVDGELQKVS